nr:unnamed protein product [Callosobruchus analis]
MTAPRINPEISVILSTPQQARDNAHLKYQASVGTAFSALGSGLNILLQQDQNISPSVKESLLKPFGDAGRILANIFASISSNRRNMILPLLAKNVKELAETTVPTELLFGDELGDRIKSAKMAETTGKSIKATYTAPHKSPYPKTGGGAGKRPHSQYIPENRYRPTRRAANLRPAQPKYAFTWDPHQVLTYLESLDEMLDNSLKTLSYKLVTLIALVTGQRLQTLYSIKVSDIVESSSGLQIFITDYLKTSGTGRQQPCLHLPFFKDTVKLCAASTLKRYLAYTNQLRKFETEYLFITFSKPHKRASKQTISRWVKDTLQAAGIDTSLFTPHSTRHASSSLALRRGVSLDVISRTAGWTEKSKCFARFYNRPLYGTDTFATAILSDA